MRHFIRHNREGELVGCDTRTYGWPTGADLRDPDTTDEVARWLQDQRADAPVQFVGWAAYDCQCPSDKGSCSCPYDLVPNHYYNGKVIFPKPALVVEVDGAPIADTDSPVSAPPGTTLRMRLLAVVPDGHTVEAVNCNGGQVELLEQSAELTFSDSASTTINLLVPAQGVRGVVRGKSLYIRGFELPVVGWA